MNGYFLPYSSFSLSGFNGWFVYGRASLSFCGQQAIKTSSQPWPPRLSVSCLHMRWRGYSRDWRGA